MAAIVLHRLRARVAQIESAPERALPLAAARIQEKFRADATTKRGNVPGFGDMGGPITVTAQSTGLRIAAPEWVMDKAYELGQPDDWKDILREELGRAAREP
jgi:hypothetical protein